MLADQPVRPQNGTARSHRLVTGLRLGWLLGALLLIAATVWGVWFSPLLGARTVNVRGVHVVSVDAVRSAAAIAPGTPLLRLDAAAIARRVEAIPDIQSASVRTSLPATVTITVVERVTVGYVTASDGYMLVDRTGRQFRAVATAPQGLPRLVVPAGGDVSEPASAASATSATSAAAASVAAALPVTILAQLSSNEAATPTDIQLHLLDGRVVRWGDASRSAEKAALLPTLLGPAATLIDLSNPDQVFTR